MIADKKIYMSPDVEIIDIELSNIMLEVSDSRGDSEDGNMVKEDDRTGDWNNIWEGM